MSGFAPGDVVVCVGVSGCHFDHTNEDDFPEMEGKTFRVLRVLPPNFRGQVGIAIGYGDPELDDWCAGCFRKVDKSDEGFAAWMRSLRPIKVKGRVEA